MRGKMAPIRFALFLSLALGILGGIGHADEGGGEEEREGEGEGRRKRGVDEEEVLIQKTIRLNKLGNVNDILSKVLPSQEIDLISVKIEGECDSVDGDNHVSAIAELDHKTFKTYVWPCSKKTFSMKHQACANESKSIVFEAGTQHNPPAEGKLRVLVLGADSTTNWTISRFTPIVFTGETVTRTLTYHPPKNTTTSVDRANDTYSREECESRPNWQSVRVLEVDVELGEERILQFTVTSEDEGLGLLVVSRDCGSSIDPTSLENVEITAETEATTMHLTFNKFGRITISKSSKPKIADGTWFVHILLDSSMSNSKRVTFAVESIYSYPNGQIWLAGILAFILGVGVVFLYYALVSDLPPLKDFFTGMQSKSMSTTVSNWFKRGNKSFSYITAVFAITFAVGGYQVVHGNWQQMIESGNRDICFYNERCYIPSANFDDFPFNLLSSNIPYVVHGFVFFLAFGLREAYCYNRGHFGYYDYSLAYAIAWSFVFEGIFSTIYHKCPTRMIFQFDTAFMFTISSLIVSALFNHYSITDEDMLLLHNRIPPKDLDLQFSNSRALRAPKVFFFFLAPILLFNYLGSLRDVHQLSTPVEVVGFLFLVLWFLFIIVWGAFKLEVVPSRVDAKPKLKDPRIEPIKKQTQTYFQENPAVIRKQQQQQQQKSSSKSGTPVKSSSKSGTPVKTASKTSTPIRFPLILKKVTQSGGGGGGGGGGREEENKKAAEAGGEAAAASEAATTATAAKVAAEAENAVEEKQKDIEEQSNEGVQEQNGAEEGGGEEEGGGGEEDGADGAEEGLSSSSSTSNFLGWMDFYRVFSLSALYVVISALFFIWLLITIFKKSDVSQFFLGTCIGSVFLSMMALEFSVIRESYIRMLKNSGREFKALRKSRTAKKIVKVIIYYIVIGIVWISAGYFFVGLEVSNKSSKPSENRDLNNPCMLLNFYDSHDVWHFLSSCGLLLSSVRAIALSFPCRYCRVENFTKLVERDKKLFVVKMKAAMAKIKVLDAMKNDRDSMDA